MGLLRGEAIPGAAKSFARRYFGGGSVSLVSPPTRYQLN